MTAIDNSEIKNQLKITNIIFLSLTLGMLSFFLIIIVLIQNKENSNADELDKIFTFIVPLIGLIMMFISRVIYNQMISKFPSGGNILQKIGNYRTAKIVAWAMIEGACFLAIIATMLTSNYLYVAVFIFLFGYFFLIKPSKESLIRDMRLNSDESDLILKS